jgi:hypothetical protein
MSKKVKAWHFVSADKMVGYAKRVPVVEGTRYYMEWPYQGYTEPTLCKAGLHASLRAFDALQYAPGPILCRVEVSGRIVHGNDKLVAEERKVLKMLDISTLLHEFACDEATRALDRRQNAGYAVDPRSRNAIAVKRLWLQGKATDAELDAARAAAEAAAEAAAWAAARAAARGAAWAAARGAARGAARAAQSKRFEAKVREAFGE